MQTHADKKQENKRRSVANTVSQRKSDSKPSFQFVDNRPETIQMRKLQEIADDYTPPKNFQFVDNRPEVVQMKRLQELAKSNAQNQHPTQFIQMKDKPATNQKVFVHKSGIRDILQKQHKNIPEPNEAQVRIMDFLNQRNHAIVKKYKMESKGTHGTNWMHAISIMQGIKSQIPKEMRTSDVTPEEGGFFVDISKSGEAQSHDFAKMAAYGTQEEATPPRYDDDEKRSAFERHIEAGKGTRRAIILEIWGQKNAQPETRKKGQQSDEDIYRTNAHLLVATLKDSL